MAEIDYDALAKQFGGVSASQGTVSVSPATAGVDYDALAKQFGGSISRQNVQAEPDRTLGGFASNIVKSGANMVSGLGHAIAHPLDTATTMLDLGAGALQNALPKGLVDFINKSETPEALEAGKRAVEVANAVGGQYKKDYGTWEGFKNKAYTDPVGVAADLSVLFSGGASALNAAKMAPAATVAAAMRGGKAAQIAETVAPTAGAIGRGATAISEAKIPFTNTSLINALEGAAKYTNPLQPVNWLASNTVKYGAPAIASVAGKVGEIVNKELPEQKAARIVREMAGNQAEAIRLAARNAPAEQTASQAISSVTENRPQMQALATEVETRAAEKYHPKAKAEERARANNIKNVTPDQAAAELTRDEISGLTYDRAMAADKMRQEIAAEEIAAGKSTAGATGYTPPSTVTPELKALKENPAIQAAAKTAKDLAATKGIKLDDPMSSLEGLHYMKLALDAQFKNPQAATALQNFSTEALQGTKQQLLAAIEGTSNAPGISPLYGVARKQYSELSAPINQAQVLNSMVKILEGPGGAERVRPFLNALGTGENALVKKATGFPRYTELEQVLTPEQMAAVNKVAGEMNRDLSIAEQAKVGRTAMAEVLRKNSIKILAPELIDAKLTFLNKIASVLQGRVSEKAMVVLGDAFQSGKNLDQLMGKIPLKERNEVLKAIGNAQFSLSPAQVRALGLESNVINALQSNPPQQNQNALAR